MPSFAAVAGLISTQLLHIADVIGSGISCSHGRCASEPSRNALEAYGRKWNGNCRRRRRTAARRTANGRVCAAGAAGVVEGSGQRSPPAALLLRLGPRVEASTCVGSAENRLASASPRILPRQIERLRQPPADIEQHVGSRPRLVQRLHRRAARRWPRRPSSPIRAAPRPTTRGTSGPAGSDPRAQLVSSRKLPKLTMYGTFSSASRTLHAFGAP